MMPRPGLPPTPASSTEIRGKDRAEAIEDFSLPPAALQTTSLPGSAFSVFAERDAGDGETSPTGTKRKRRRPSMSNSTEPQATAQAAGGEATFSLPPPPARSRKIIQVQPEDAKGSPSKSSGGQGKKKNEAGKSSTAASNAKPTAASRKTARKTAHSIIERRRRSKMNDEFETLKELVPAARGQNMHKLAILQAGIEYVRYLEDCVKGLKGAQAIAPNKQEVTIRPNAHEHAVERGKHVDQEMDEDDEDDDETAEDDEDEDMDEEEPDDRQSATTPKASRPASAQQSYSDVSSNTTSPAIQPLRGMHSHNSSSSYAVSIGSSSPAMLPLYNSSSYSATAVSSTLPSPALGPSDSKNPYAGFGSGQITPITSSSEYHALQAHAKKTLASHGEADHEVIATLTMMGTERRRSQEEKERMDGTRGMSVRDLLSG